MKALGALVCIVVVACSAIIGGVVGMIIGAVTLPTHLFQMIQETDDQNLPAKDKI